MKKEFTRILLKWHKQSNTRTMPWKGEKDPYRIWLSEVILQQTRVAQGWQYYHNFITRYPTVSHLANAIDQDVFKLWEGLGYYNRCKNLLFTARQIMAVRQGVFPCAYEDILQLKGVGPYTAAAISSFAFNMPYAVVDGNVFRVLSRFFGIDTPIDSAAGKRQFAALADEVLDRKVPGLYNQAIMDFGAVICKPFSPACSDCPLRKYCTAYAEGTVNQLPVKEKTLLRKSRWFYYFIFEHENKLLVHLRTRKDIWQNLFEFYLLESHDQVKWNDTTVRLWLNRQAGISRVANLQISPVSVQQLTHQEIRGQFIRITLDKVPDFLKRYSWHPVADLRKLPFPKFITQYLDVTRVLDNSLQGSSPAE